MTDTVFTEEEFPHGLRCMDCDHRFVRGEWYSERLTGMLDDAIVTELVCVPCAIKQAVA